MSTYSNLITMLRLLPEELGTFVARLINLANENPDFDKVGDEYISGLTSTVVLDPIGEPRARIYFEKGEFKTQYLLGAFPIPFVPYTFTPTHVSMTQAELLYQIKTELLRLTREQSFYTKSDFPNLVKIMNEQGTSPAVMIGMLNHLEAFPPQQPKKKRKLL